LTEEEKEEVVAFCDHLIGFRRPGEGEEFCCIFLHNLMEDKNYLDEFLPETIVAVRRRKLLPVWMKIFIWIFLVIGVCSVPGFIAGLFGFSFSIAIYGFDTNEPTSTTGIFLLLIFLLKGMVAYALWFEKDWAINLGLFDAFLGIAVCIALMIFQLTRDGLHFEFRLEILVLIPYLIKLYRIRKPWVTYPYNLV
jgi:hypothetical protein